MSKMIRLGLCALVLLVGSTLPAKSGPRVCTKFLDGTKPGWWRIYNSCDDCKKVVVDHTGGAQPITETFQVPAHSSIEIQQKRPTMSIIDESNC